VCSDPEPNFPIIGRSKLLQFLRSMVPESAWVRYSCCLERTTIPTMMFLLASSSNVSLASQESDELPAPSDLAIRTCSRLVAVDWFTLVHSYDTKCEPLALM
jgi:hypothetical protein